MNQNIYELHSPSSDAPLATKATNFKAGKFKNMGGSVAFFAVIGTTIILSSSQNNESFYTSPQKSYITNIKLDGSWGDMGIYNDCFVDVLKLENISKINKMKYFTEDWNGHGAKPFSNEAIQLFLNIIENVSKQPKIAPTGASSLLLQYELSDKSILAFDVSVDHVECAYVPGGNYSLAKTDVFTEDVCNNINNYVEKFYGKK